MSIFKAYDIRGTYPDEINEDIAYAIGRAYAEYLKPKTLAIGHDVRISSPSIYKSIKSALSDAGVDIFEIGPISTEMLYFAVGFYGFDGGITVTASHNPREYNGMKMVKGGSKPISYETGLAEIEKLTKKFINLKPKINAVRGTIKSQKYFGDYKKYILGFAKCFPFKKMKVVANANFGFQYQFAKKILNSSNIELIPLNGEPDGTFPKGRPDPFVVENRKEFLDTIIKEKADFGVAWDADADRCFFATDEGEFLEAYYINAILSKIMLSKNPKSKIIYDVRYTWAIIDQVDKIGGTAIESKVGHSFIKENMRRHNALFCGESSGHYYFRDFYFCDSGMIPFILILDLLSESNQSLAEITKNLRSKYFVSGELNYQIENSPKIIKKILDRFQDDATRISNLDKLTMEFDHTWRFNIRTSNTEPLLRLNIEGESAKIVSKKKQLLENIIYE